MRCSNCGKVSNASQLRDGYCLSCKPELFSKLTESNKETIEVPQNIQNTTEPKKEDTFSGIGFSFIIGLIAGIAVLIFLVNAKT